MSKRNGRAKQLEKQLRETRWKLIRIEREQKEHGIELLSLQEENSELRRLLDEQNDYIKQGFKEFREALADQNQYEEYLYRRVTDEIKLRRRKDNELREEIAVIGRKIKAASWTWLGKFIFK